MAIDYRKKFKEKLEKNKSVQKKIHEKYDKLLDATNHLEEYEWCYNKLLDRDVSFSIKYQRKRGV